MSTPRVAVAELRRFIEAVLDAFDVPSADAETTALRMLEADLRGMTGHGILRLPAYVERLEAGGYNVRPRIRVLHETPVSALVDGDNGLGQVVVTRAVETAIAKAGSAGLAWVGIRGSNHAGAGGVYASMPLEHGMIGIYLAVGSANHLAPWGGVDRLLSTNPVAVAIPAGEEPPVVLDMATTVVSYGRIKVAADRGEPLPEGWVVDRTGAPVTDPHRAHEGYLLPIGGYKGYGLGLVIGLLAGVLNGAAFGSAVVDFAEDHVTPPNTGQTVIAVRPDLFGPADAFAAEMDRRIQEIRRSTPIAGGPPVRIPGDRVAERRAEALADGIALDDALVDRLMALAARLGIDEHPFPTPRHDP